MSLIPRDVRPLLSSAIARKRMADELARLLPAHPEPTPDPDESCGCLCPCSLQPADEEEL